MLPWGNWKLQDCNSGVDVYFLLGHVISAEGLHPSEEKVCAI